MSDTTCSAHTPTIVEGGRERERERERARAHVTEFSERPPWAPVQGLFAIAKQPYQHRHPIQSHPTRTMSSILNLIKPSFYIGALQVVSSTQSASPPAAPSDAASTPRRRVRCPPLPRPPPLRLRLRRRPPPRLPRMHASSRVLPPVATAVVRQDGNQCAEAGLCVPDAHDVLALRARLRDGVPGARP